jgi:hypothetical protein
MFTPKQLVSKHGLLKVFEGLKSGLMYVILDFQIEL